MTPPAHFAFRRLLLTTMAVALLMVAGLSLGGAVSASAAHAVMVAEGSPCPHAPPGHDHNHHDATPSCAFAPVAVGLPVIGAALAALPLVAPKEAGPTATINGRTDSPRLRPPRFDV